jgi:hypothetical protein
MVGNPEIMGEVRIGPAVSEFTPVAEEKEIACHPPMTRL